MAALCRGADTRGSWDGGDGFPETLMTAFLEALTAEWLGESGSASDMAAFCNSG